MRTVLAASLLVLTAASGCSTEPLDPVPAGGEVSACGGFESQGQPLYGDAATYCDAEVLHWTYDAATGRLDLADTRALLNCCGDHQAGIETVADVLVLRESDAPEAGAGRCDCLCVFDFRASAEGVEAGTIALRIEREVTDSGAGRVTIFEAEIDTTEGAGALVVDATDVAPWCEAT